MASLCDTMRRQILSRAFYGWLAYCRHLKTVRTHLTSLVNPVLKMDNNEKPDPNLALKLEGWTELFLNKQQENLPIDKKEIYRRIYSGGCEPSIRRQVKLLKIKKENLIKIDLTNFLRFGHFFFHIIHLNLRSIKEIILIMLRLNDIIH